MSILTSVSNVLLIILGFGVLIFVHELGHFLAARWANIRAEAFAVGMGPVALAWRKGMGLRFGSTHAEYEQRVRDQLKSRGQEPQTLSPSELYRVGDELGLGETEYSLRWLPIGGFVKMLGQEDANPNYVSDDPRSYNMCPVPKRMVVVAAGVVMNLILAVLLFVVAFMVGVTFPAPMIGAVSPTLAAGTTAPSNAAAAGVTDIGLQPGDTVTHIDGDAATTFADLQIASAMSRPDTAVNFTVQRPGVALPLEFSLLPQKNSNSGLLSIGVEPGASNILKSRDEGGILKQQLEEIGLAAAGVQPGMAMQSANGQPIETFEQYNRIADACGGKPVETTWSHLDDEHVPTGTPVRAVLPVEPEFQVLRYPPSSDEVDEELANLQVYEQGLLGLTPLVRIARIPDDSPNRGVLELGDVILGIGNLDAPRYRDFLAAVRSLEPGEVDLRILRRGEKLTVKATVVRRGMFKSSGMLNIALDYAWDTPLIAQPLNKLGEVKPGQQVLEAIQSPIADANPIPGTLLESLNGVPIANWFDFQRELVNAAKAAKANPPTSAPVTVQLGTVLPTAGAERQVLTVPLTSKDIDSLLALGWRTELNSTYFEPVYTIRTANGNPIKAAAMGFQETYKLIVLTYLTIDRLFRGSVGVEQLRGPVGIVHIGSKIADQGFMYLLFFLGMISVNLAVINFLPLPIVDGGLFLFLLYEKFKGRPPSLAFQNAATIVGLCLIGSIFIVTFYNDVMRLFG